MSEVLSKRILVVDDEEDILFCVVHILKHANYEVISTTKGREALQLALNLIPDLIILDLIIPDMLGGEVANILSQNPTTSKIPIIFLSALNTKEDEKIIREETGRYHILAKPISREEVLYTVSKFLA